MEKEKICGIYCIENIVNNKKYIGQSCDVYNRWYHHKYCLNNNRHSNTHLQRAWNQYGEGNFKFYIIQKCNEEDIDKLEQYYISVFKTLIKDNGYNLDSGGNMNKHHSEETCKKISKKHMGKILSSETKRKISENRKGKMCGKDHFRYGKPLPKWQKDILIKSAKERCGSKAARAKQVICLNNGQIFDTIKDAGIKYSIYGANEQNINKCCNHHRRYSGKFPNGEKIIWAYYEENKEYTYIAPPPPNTFKKSVSQYTKDGKLIKTYDSARDAERETGISYKLISATCKNEKPSAKGFIWRFSEDDFDKYPIRNGHYKAVSQYDLNGNLIKTFNSIQEANLAIGGINISPALHGRTKTAGGYIWKFAS